ncbi:MAG: hypothetical protein OEU32_15185 [Acidimicrobiia bacterium]|nr:hypothetical protein [Acidimicrobiia bacterium]
MFLFSRVVTLQGAPNKTMAFASGMTEYVNANSSLDTTLWQALFGHPLGTMAWSTVVESRAQLAEGMMELMAQDRYHELIDGAQEFTSTVASQDYLRELVHGAPPDEPPGIGAVSNIITAAPAPGRLGDVMAWGPQIADKYAAITGANVAFCADAYGRFGQVTWILLHADMAAVDAAEAAAGADASYVAEVAGSGELFVAGSGETRLLLRVA